MGCIVCNLIAAAIIEDKEMPKMPENYPTREQRRMKMDMENEIAVDIATHHPEMVAEIFRLWTLEQTRLARRVSELEDKTNT